MDYNNTYYTIARTTRTADMCTFAVTSYCIIKLPCKGAATMILVFHRVIQLLAYYVTHRFYLPLLTTYQQHSVHSMCRFAVTSCKLLPVKVVVQSINKYDFISSLVGPLMVYKTTTTTTTRNYYCS